MYDQDIKYYLTFNISELLLKPSFINKLTECILFCDLYIMPFGLKEDKPFIS